MTTLNQGMLIGNGSGAGHWPAKLVLKAVSIAIDVPRPAAAPSREPSLIVSSSRGRSDRATGAANQPANSAWPASVISYGPCPPSSVQQRPHRRIAFKPGQGRVNLADFQRTRAASGLFKGDPQLVAVHRAAFQQSEKTVLDRHRYQVCIPGMVMARSHYHKRSWQSPRPGSAGDHPIAPPKARQSRPFDRPRIRVQRKSSA